MDSLGNTLRHAGSWNKNEQVIKTSITAPLPSNPLYLAAFTLFKL